MLRFATSREVLGAEYAKAIRLSKINLGILSEVRKGASSGDLITAPRLKNPKIPPIDAEEYGTMYVVAVPRIGSANLVRLNY